MVSQNEESETWIGEWMQQRGNRDEMVIATKVSLEDSPLNYPLTLPISVYYLLQEI
jgi:aryl-alcohol dehydrogenase-like predicted oxidoreductase